MMTSISICLGGEGVSDSGLIADTTPPFGLYLANFDQIQPLGNSFTSNACRDRYYQFVQVIPP